MSPEKNKNKKKNSTLPKTMLQAAGKKSPDCSCYSPVVNNLIRFILTAAHCVVKCKPCRDGRRVKTSGGNYLIKAGIGRFKNGDIYNIIKVIQHPEFEEMSRQKVVKYTATKHSDQLSNSNP